MSSTPNRASNSAGKQPRRKEITLDLPTARQMLPLVKSIVADIVALRLSLNKLSPEQARLERQRRELVWAERQRRYQVDDEMAFLEKNLAAAVSELGTLGVAVVDDEAGEIDFPTKVNGRTAAFTWKLGEELVGHWHYAGEENRRPIPTDWTEKQTAPARSRSSR